MKASTNSQSPTWHDVRDLTVRERLDIGFDELKDKWQSAPPTFTEETLTICGHPVMERWEENYMSELAEIATSKGGNVLEVGFGMGISAGFVQQHAIETHTVIEANQEVFERLRQFAAAAAHPVIPLLGFWETVTPNLKDASFSGILFDTYPLVPDEVHKNHFAFFQEAFRLLKPGGVLTYYSDEIAEYSPEHLACLRQAGFSQITARPCPVQPPAGCRYWKSRTILSPIVIK